MSLVMDSKDVSNELVSSDTNPWLQSAGIYTSIGGFKDILRVEKRFGLLQEFQGKVPRLGQDNDSEIKEISLYTSRHDSSSEKVESFRRISRISREVRNLKANIFLRQMKAQTSDVMNTSSLNQLIALLEQNSKDLENLLQRKTLILSALQADTSECLVLAASSQWHLNETLPLLTKQLSNNTTYLDDFDWISKLQRKIDEINNDYNHISWYASYLKQQTACVNGTREVMDKFAEKHNQ